MSDTPVSLKTLLYPSKTISIEYPGIEGFKLDICYLAREELIKLRKKCVKPVFSNGIAGEEFNSELFGKLYTEAVIKGWTGLKYKYLEEFLLVDVSAFEPEDELPYSKDNAETLLNNGVDFDEWLTATLGKLENFTGNK